MFDLANHKEFQEDYEKLREVSLNPERHSAENAWVHCEMVRDRVLSLAKLNNCTTAEIELLSDLARVHDIGKIQGTARPEESVQLLSKYGIENEQFVNLVKYHDTNLPWYIAHTKEQPPSDKAWNKLAAKVDVRLLCLFMVADRIDCPGGWQANEPLVWFLDQVDKRNLIEKKLILDDVQPLDS